MCFFKQGILFVNKVLLVSSLLMDVILKIAYLKLKKDFDLFLIYRIYCIFLLTYFASHA